MQLLASYDSQEEGESAERKLSGKKRLASERDSNQVVWNLFGEATWANFYQIGMYDLSELKSLLAAREAGESYDLERHQLIINQLGFVETSYSLKIPAHWK